MPGGHTGLAYAFDSIWSPTRKDELDRIDPNRAAIIASIKLGDGIVDCNNFMLVTVSAVWVGHCDKGELIKIDPATNSIASKIPFGRIIDQAKAQTTMPQGKVTDFIWLLVPDREKPQSCGLVPMDPETGSGLFFRSIGPDCNGLAVTSDALWLSGNNQIDRFNPKTNQIDETYKLEQGVGRLGVGFGSLWVIYETRGFVQHLDIAP